MSQKITTPAQRLIEDLEAARVTFNSITNTVPFPQGPYSTAEQVYSAALEAFCNHECENQMDLRTYVVVFQQRVKEEAEEVKTWGEDAVPPLGEFFQIADATFRNINAVLVSYPAD